MAQVPEDKPESKLCDKCAVLRINDENLGDYNGKQDCENPVLTYRVGYVGSGSERKYVAGRRFKLAYQRHDRFPLLPSLTVDAKDCEFCDALRQATLNLPLDGPCEIHYNSMYYERWRLDSGVRGLKKLSVVAEFRYDVGALHNVMRTMDFLVDATGQCMNWLQTSESPSDEVLSAANLEWLEQQLRICDEECGLFPASNFCPTRLIDVSWGNSRNGIVRLIETRTDQAFPSPQYAALSYCWGSKEDALTQLKTTTSNLTQHLKNIPFQLMTPIIRDTIHLCRLLRIRYLWVDALCILQDDGEDWAREAAQMGSVYTNAYVTICTPTTSTCRDSFLHRTTPIRVRFESTVRPGINGYLNLRHQPTQHLYCMHTTTFECDMDVGTWRTRAWTFQEEQLSKRRLYFGATRMYLSCPRKILTEPSLSRDSNTVHFHDALNAFKTAADYARLYDMWIEFIKDYASRELTFERDRFPAISGLASLVAEATGDEYIVGLWKNDIVRGLLWAEGRQRERDMVMGQRCRQTASPMTYACPSWSWAAGSKPNYDRLSSAACGPDPIREAEWELRSQCKLITTLCEPENLALSRFGRVRAAKLHLQAKLLAAGNNWRHLGKQKSANQWKCAISDECVATYDLDWMVKGQEDYWTVENQKESLNFQDIHMLLLASTVGGDWSWESNHYTPLASPMDSDCEESSAEDGDENSDPDSNEQNLKSNTKSTYPATHKAPSTATSLQVVENEPLKRHAWGLLLLPVDKSDTFIRVGRFKIWAQMGGLTPFENCVYRHVEII